MDSPTIWAAGMMTILAAPRLAGRRRSARVVRPVRVRPMGRGRGMGRRMARVPALRRMVPVHRRMVPAPARPPMVPAPVRVRPMVLQAPVRGHPRVAFPFRFFVRFIWWHPWRQSHHASYRTEIRSTGSAVPSSKLTKDNGLNIADFAVGDMISHDQYGLGKVTDAQDKGRNSVITVDFGSAGVKRLMLRVAPIEKL